MQNLDISGSLEECQFLIIIQAQSFRRTVHVLSIHHILFRITVILSCQDSTVVEVYRTFLPAEYWQRVNVCIASD